MTTKRGLRPRVAALLSVALTCVLHAPPALAVYPHAHTERHAFEGAELLRTKLADGCRHVFLDVGSNRGVHVRSLFEPALFPGSMFVNESLWTRYFGPGHASDPSVCAFGWEPNAEHAERLRRLGLYYRAGGRRVEWFHSAAMERPGLITMYNHRGDASASDWRFGRNRPSWHPVNVSAIDLAAWIRDEVVGRRLPPEPRGGGRTPPSVLMKLDVEGDELPLLERMLDLGVLCSVDLLTWEFHDYLMKPQV